MSLIRKVARPLLGANFIADGVDRARKAINSGAARAKLLQMFEAVGLEDAWVVATRRRLSRLLFG